MLGTITKLGNESGSGSPPSAASTMALELLGRCGMIFRANLRNGGLDGAAHQSLSRRVHYSLVIFPNCLNLSGGSRV